jgi:hypothetical protein
MLAGSAPLPPARSRSPVGVLSGVWFLYIVGFAFLGCCLVAIWRGARLPGALWCYSAILLAQSLLYSNVGPRPRFLLAAFPLFLLLAHGASRWMLVLFAILFPLLLGVSAGLHVAGVMSP